MASHNGWPTSTSTQLQLLDDVANHDVEMQPATADTIYVILDTNILLHHIKILKNFVEDIAFANAPVVVVCPGIVLNELDFQKNRPELGRLARNATDWMMHEVTRKDLVQPIVKGQAQRETCRPTGNWKVRQKGEVLSNDEIIVDCCKYFHSKASAVLYTGDKNLCLRCDQEGLRFVSPPRPHEYTSLDLVKCIQGLLPEYASYLGKIVRNYHRVVRGKQDDGMMIDEDIQAQVPHATLVHLQVVEQFLPLFQELVKRVGGEEIENFYGLKKNGASVSRYAPRWQQNDKLVDEWEVVECLEYLQLKKGIVFPNPEPPLGRFLRNPYSGSGALSGVEWSASAWKASAENLRQVGETFNDEVILHYVDLLDQYVKAEYS